MGRQGPSGSYELADSPLFAQIGAERRGQSKTQPIAPDARIVRAVDMNDDRSVIASWREYLDTIGQKNYGKGNAKSLGSLALTMVNATELGRMIAKRQPQLYENRSSYPQLLTYLRRLRDDYGEFVQSRSDELVALQCRGVFEPLDDKSQTRIRSMWGHGIFEVKNGMQNFGKCDQSIVFELDDEEVLLDEMQATWRFLRDEHGLDTTTIDQSRRPHLSAFDTFNPIAHVALKAALMPNTIGLAPPHVVVNTNSPTHP